MYYQIHANCEILQKKKKIKKLGRRDLLTCCRYVITTSVGALIFFLKTIFFIYVS